LLESQIDIISQFYSQAAYLDDIINIISDEKNKTWIVLEEFLLPDGRREMRPKETILPSGYILVKGNIGQSQASQILADVTSKIEFIYNSPAVDKLRAIAEGKL
jgi:hypothetical protein